MVCGLGEEGAVEEVPVEGRELFDSESIERGQGELAIAVRKERVSELRGIRLAVRASERD
ncbi:MAG TPA: hypothetical protein VF662_15585 [Allosphingosinicella sp.]